MISYIIHPWNRGWNSSRYTSQQAAHSSDNTITHRLRAHPATNLFSLQTRTCLTHGLTVSTIKSVPRLVTTPFRSVQRPAPPCAWRAGRHATAT